jgi:hypothetical protein
MLALRSKPKAPAGQSRADLGFESFKGALHALNSKPKDEIINIWNNSKSH